MTAPIPSGAATNHDRIPAAVFDAAMMAAFPALPDGMGLDEAARRIAAALNAALPLIAPGIEWATRSTRDDTTYPSKAAAMRAVAERDGRAATDNDVVWRRVGQWQAGDTNHEED